MYIQQNLKAPKGQYNKFGEYRYRSCEDIQESVKPLLKEVNAVLLLTDDIKLIGDRFYIVATAMIQDVESEEFITNTAYARETDAKPKMDAAQITGSCSSYARKYALNGLFCIDDTKDPDTMDNCQRTAGKETGQKAAEQKRGQGQQAGTRKSGQEPQARAGDRQINLVNENHIATIRAEIKRTGAKEEAVCYQYSIHSLIEMTIPQYKDAMAIFKQMPTKNRQMSLDEMYTGALQ